jgi:hypothetical protein
VWSCRDGGEHHTESLKLSKADERFRFRRGLLAPEMVRAGPYLDGGLPAWGSPGRRGRAFPVSAAREACQAWGVGRCDRCHWLLLDNPFIFWT